MHGRLPPHSCLRKGSSSTVAVEFHATGDAREVAVALLLSLVLAREETAETLWLHSALPVSTAPAGPGGVGPLPLTRGPGLACRRSGRRRHSRRRASTWVCLGPLGPECLVGGALRIRTAIRFRPMVWGIRTKVSTPVRRSRGAPPGDWHMAPDPTGSGRGTEPDVPARRRPSRRRAGFLTFHPRTPRQSAAPNTGDNFAVRRRRPRVGSRTRRHIGRRCGGSGQRAKHQVRPAA